MTLRFRREIIWVAKLLVLLALLPGCFAKERLVDYFSGEDIAAVGEQTADGIKADIGQMVLTPGVYKVQLQTSLSEGQTMKVEVKCDATYFRSLRTNSIPIFAGNDFVEFEVWVLDKVPAAYLQCSIANAGAEAFVEAEVYKTAMGNRILLFLTLLGFAVLDFLSAFRRGILEGCITKKQQIVFWGLTTGVLIAYFPYLTGYFSIGADSLFHWSRVAFLKESLEQGAAFPVRVQSGWLSDHGYAASLFYGDLFLYIPALLQLLGFPLMTAYKMFIFLIMLVTVWVAYFSIKKCVRDEYAALCGSLLYMLIPYHIFNFYNRDALGECQALMFLPLVVCGMYLLYTEDVTDLSYKKNKWYLIWGMSGILESHLITTEMTAILIAVACILFLKRTFRKQTFLQLAEAVGITLLINAWFWVPLLYMMRADVYLLAELSEADLQSRGVLFAGLFQWLPNRGSAQTGMYNCEPVQLGAGAYLLFMVYAVWRCRRRGRRACDIFAAGSVLTVFASTKYFPWNAISEMPGIGFVISSLQFPSRWMVPATALTAFFAASFFLELKGEKNKILRAAVGAIGCITIFSSVYHVNSIIYLNKAYFVYNDINIGTTGVGNGEYLLEGTTASDYYYHKPVADSGLEWSNYEKEGTTISISLNNTLDETAYLELPLIGYRGYSCKAEQEADEMPYIAEERGEHGDLRIAVPAGYQGSVNVSYTGFALFHAAEALSGAGILILAAWGIYCLKKERTRQVRCR